MLLLYSNFPIPKTKLCALVSCLQSPSSAYILLKWSVVSTTFVTYLESSSELHDLTNALKQLHKPGAHPPAQTKQVIPSLVFQEFQEIQVQ